MHFSLTWNKCNHKLRYLQLIFPLDCMQMNFFSLFSLWKINNNLTDFLLKTKDQKIWYSTSFHCLSMQFLKYHICKVLSSALLAHNLGKTSISDVTWDTLCFSSHPLQILGENWIFCVMVPWSLIRKVQIKG